MIKPIVHSVYFCLLIALFTACGSGKTEDGEIPSIPEASSEKIGHHIQVLASDSLQGRMTGTQGIEEAAQYIQNELQNYGYKGYDDSYRHQFTIGSNTGENVVAILPGTDAQLKNEIVLLGAHYDHIGVVNPIAGDSIANGANDNASGVATVMEIARLLKETGGNKRTVMVALFSAEEKGLVGSRKLAKDMRTERNKLYAMVNFEMTGVPMTSGKRSYITGYKKSNMADIFNKHMQRDTITGYLPQAAQFNLFMRSDNYPFHLEFGVPAQTISTFDFTNYDYYHKPGDHAELMDTDHMSQLINEVMPGLMDIINGDDLQLMTENNG